VLRFLKRIGSTAFLQRMRDEEQPIAALYFDEAQDTDVLQNLFVCFFAGDAACPVRTTIVGDLKQSLYSWRGAVPEQFRVFHDEAHAAVDPGAASGHRAHRLHHSYRVQSHAGLTTLNGLVNAVAQQPYSRGAAWEYVPARDDLVAPPGKALSSTTPELAYWRRAAAAPRDVLGESAWPDLDAFFADGHCGVLVRSRSALSKSGLRDYLAGRQVRYRIADVVDFTAEACGDAALWAQGPLPDVTLLHACGALLDGGDAPVAHALTLLCAPSCLPALQALVPQLPAAGPDHVVHPRALWQAARAAAAPLGDAGKGLGLLRLLDRFGLWRLLGTGDGGQQQARSRRRLWALASMLAAREERARQQPEAVPVVVDFEGEALPFDWFPGPGKPAAGGRVLEVTTVHSSKGFEYDRVAVVGDLAEDFFPTKIGHAVRGGDGEAAAGLSSFAFGRQFDRQPDVRPRCFPWLGSTGLKIGRATDPSASHSLIGTQYTAVERRLLHEKRNLFYVAVTRTRGHLLLVHLGKGDLPLDPVLPAPRCPFLPAGSPAVARASTFAAPLGAPLRHADLAPVARLRPSLPFVSVRTLAGNDDAHAGPSSSSLSSSSPARTYDHEAAWRRMQVGSGLHQLLERLAWVRAHPDALAQAIEWSRGRGWRGEQAVFVLQHEENEAAVAAVLAAFARARAVLPEVPIWGVDDGSFAPAPAPPGGDVVVDRDAQVAHEAHEAHEAHDGPRLVRGVLDGLAVTASGALSVVEYKTAFGAPDAQQSAGERQARVYGHLLAPSAHGPVRVEDPLVAVFCVPRGRRGGAGGQGP
jgi:hypothetical protein